MAFKRIPWRRFVTMWDLLTPPALGGVFGKGGRMSPEMMDRLGINPRRNMPIPGQAPFTGTFPDVFPSTPGMQLGRGIGEAFRTSRVSSRSRMLQRDPTTGRVFLLAVDPRNPEFGIQVMPPGTSLSDFPKGMTVYGQLVTGEIVPLTRKSRRMNFLNPRALRGALKRTDGAASLCKRIIKADKKNKQTFRKPKKRKKRL